MADHVSFDPFGFFNQRMPLNQTNWAAYFGPTIPDGVIEGIGDELEVYANSSGMVVYVKAGECRVRSHRGVLASEATLDITAADATYARKDLIVARVTYGTPSTMEITVKTGTPAASPETPSVTQNAGDVWEIPLAEVDIAANAVTIAETDVTDVRYVYTISGASVHRFSGSSFAARNNWEYRCSDTSLSSLQITLPDTPSDIWQCSVVFTSGSSFSGVTFQRNGSVYTPKLQGVSLNIVSKRYNLVIWWDGEYFWCSAGAA